MSGEIKSGRLPALEQAALEYQQSKEPEILERLVILGEPLVRHFARLYSAGRPDDDLRQAGFEGLLKAARRFTPHRGVLFATYASHCIIGEVRRELKKRRVYRVPDCLAGLQAAILRATDELLQKNGTAPTLKEIAAMVNVTEAGISEAMLAGTVSLEELDLSAIRSIRYETFKLPLEDELTIQMALDKLSELPRKVLTLIFYGDLTQEQVARRLGTNQRRVSRILNRGLAEMRKAVSG